MPYENIKIVENGNVQHPETNTDQIYDFDNNRTLTTTIRAFDEHLTNGTNPHGTTKDDVGLGSVSNYEIANETDAIEGTATNFYMNPLSTRQSVEARTGLLPNLQTTNKNDLVSAINETFTQAVNGKTAISNAINGKGGTVNSTDTFAELATAITDLPGGIGSNVDEYDSLVLEEKYKLVSSNRLVTLATYFICSTLENPTLTYYCVQSNNSSYRLLVRDESTSQTIYNLVLPVAPISSRDAPKPYYFYNNKLYILATNSVIIVDFETSEVTSFSTGTSGNGIVVINDYIYLSRRTVALTNPYLTKYTLTGTQISEFMPSSLDFAYSTSMRYFGNNELVFTTDAGRSSLRGANGTVFIVFNIESETVTKNRRATSSLASTLSDAKFVLNPMDNDVHPEHDYFYAVHRQRNNLLIRISKETLATVSEHSSVPYTNVNRYDVIRDIIYTIRTADVASIIVIRFLLNGDYPSSSINTEVPGIAGYGTGDQVEMNYVNNELILFRDTSTSSNSATSGLVYRLQNRWRNIR